MATDKELIVLLKELVQELRLLRGLVAAESRTESGGTFERIWGGYQANELIRRDRERKEKERKIRKITAY